MSDLLLIYGVVTMTIFCSGIGCWLQAKDDRLKRDEQRIGAQVALLAWSWPVALPIVIVIGLIWLIRELLSDALDY